MVGEQLEKVVKKVRQGYTRWRKEQTTNSIKKVLF